MSFWHLIRTFEAPNLEKNRKIVKIGSGSGIWVLRSFFATPPRVCQKRAEQNFESGIGTIIFYHFHTYSNVFWMGIGATITLDKKKVLKKIEKSRIFVSRTNEELIWDFGRFGGFWGILTIFHSQRGYLAMESCFSPFRNQKYLLIGHLSCTNNIPTRNLVPLFFFMKFQKKSRFSLPIAVMAV